MGKKSQAQGFQSGPQSPSIANVALEALGLRFFAQEGSRLPILTAVHIPEGVSDATVRSNLLRQYNIEIGGGQGPVAGKIWRIGLMGENATASNVLTLLSALEEVLPQAGYEVARGESVAAAQRALDA